MCQRWLNFSSREQSTISLDTSQNCGLLCYLHHFSPQIQYVLMCLVQKQLLHLPVIPGMSRHDLLLLGSSLDTYTKSVMDFCLRDWRNTLVMVPSMSKETCWVKMNCHSQFLAQADLGEILGKNLHVLVKKKSCF